MGNLDILAGARIDKIGRKIRDQLTVLRRRKLILSSQNTKPERNRALDPLLGQLQSLRVRFDFQIRKVAAEQTHAPAEDQALARAREILADAAEMTDLLIWFGADMPEGDAEPETMFGSRAG